MVFCAVSVASAVEENVPAPQTRAELLATVAATPMKGVLTAPDGTKHEISGKLVRASLLEDDVMECTYAYDIPVSRGSGNNTEEGTDNSASVKAYNTVQWSTATGNNGAPCALLTRVQGNWNIMDSQVSVTNCSVQYMCIGLVMNGSADTSQNVTRSSVSNNYSISTGFSKYVETQGMGCMVGNKMTLTLRRGTSNIWAFEVVNIPFQA